MKRRLKIAFVSPVNPKPCGVSDYTEDLLPYLGKLVDIDLVTESYGPSSQEIVKQFGVIGVDEFRARAAGYDAIVYQIANSFRYHGYAVPLLAEYPGVVVLHDFSLQYLMLGLSAAQGDPRLLERFLKPSYQGQAGSLARKLFFSRVDPYEVSMVRPLLDWATGVIVHSESVQAKVLEEAPDRKRDVRFMRMAVPVDDEPPTSDGLRKLYGLSGDEFVLASVSTLSYTKRLELVLEAVRRLKPRFPRIRFIIIGGGNLGARVRNQISRYGLEDTVVHTGRVSASQYRDYIRLSDAVVDLRYPSGTEASASLTRAVAAGKPVIVSEHGWFLGLPNDFSVKIPVNKIQPDEFSENSSAIDAVVTAIAGLIEDPDRRAAMGRAAWEFARTHLRLEECAARYMEFVEELIARPIGERHPASAPLYRRQGGVRRLVLASVYNAFRLPHIARSYGLADTLDKIRRELTRTKTAAAES
jgi:glycosyltransferase involved in cell wall biosynthesis